jgi:TetR/AcrR family transcriptional regulator
MDINNEQNMEKSILEAAENLFLESGFKATSTTQIAKAVGCNQALVHYYFRTKENLFNTIFENKFRNFFQSIFDTTHLVNMNFTEKIKYITLSHFDLLNKNPKLPKLIFNELSNRPENIQTLKEKLRTLPEKLFSMLSAELQSEIEAGRVRNVEVMDIVITIVSLNVALFTMAPIAISILGIDDQTKDLMLMHRREENVKLILRYLQP